MRVCCTGHPSDTKSPHRPALPDAASDGSAGASPAQGSTTAVRHVRYSRWRSTPARHPQSLWLPVIHHSGRAKLLLSRTRCPNPQRNCPEHNPSSNRRATDATDPYKLCASVLKKLTRDPASTDLGLESPSYSNSCPFVVQIAPLRLSVSIRVHPWRRKRPGHATCTRVFASSRESINQDPHPRTPVRGSPDRKPKTELVRFPSRLRGFA